VDNKAIEIIFLIEDDPEGGFMTLAWGDLLNIILFVSCLFPIYFV